MASDFLKALAAATARKNVRLHIKNKLRSKDVRKRVKENRQHRVEVPPEKDEALRKALAKDAEMAVE